MGNKFLGLLPALAAFIAFSGHAQKVEGPGGIQTTCDSLLATGSRTVTPSPDSLMFGVRLSDWTPQTVDDLKRGVDACVEARHLRIRPDYIERVKAKIDDISKIPERRRLEEEKQAALALQRKQIADCQASDQYALYSAQERVIADIENIKGWQENQAQERRIARASGVRNLWEERNNGEWIVQSTDDLKADFSEYKRLGGKEKTPQKVTHRITNPCSASGS